MALTTMPRIATLNLATLALPDWHPEAANDPVCRVYGYAIDHPDGTILFDTGVGVGNEFIDEVYEPQIHLLDDELGNHGFAADSVIAIINSHLHFDHCGQNPLFYGTEIPVFIQQAEVDIVDRDAYYTDATWALAPEAQRRSLDGDLEIVDGVSILATPGHTAGHQSLLVEGGSERIVIAGQAVWNSIEYVNEVATPSNVDTPELRTSAVESIRRIKSLRPGVVFFSHCSEHRSHSDAESDPNRSIAADLNGR
ncbi:MAG: MBL fold metallo-hydrolase [Actinomycetota bacterium]